MRDGENNLALGEYMDKETEALKEDLPVGFIFLGWRNSMRCSILRGELTGFVAIVGMIAIMGMVVRNSVILIDQIRQHLEEGMTPYKAIIDSAVICFRPIMLTSFAEVLGMISLLPNPFRSPMSVSFIGGLALATPLGLLFVPALYAWWYDVKETDEKGTWEK